MSRFTVHLRAGELVRVEQWPAGKTAIIICDMWDSHWCSGAAQRVDELAPVMNGVLKAARAKGALIVHAPSDTMNHYADYPQRLRVLNCLEAPAPTLKPVPRGPRLPIDDSDGGCAEGGEPFGAWSCQHRAIEIAEEDAISDSGTEIYSLLHQVGIENVAVMGVHTNMCILGRSFGLRRMVEIGMNAVLVRDLTDSMYNPARTPFVSHFQGTALVVDYIERFVCPSMESTDLSGEPSFRFRGDPCAPASLGA